MILQIHIQENVKKVIKYPVSQKHKFHGVELGKGKYKTIPSVGRNPKNSFMLIPKFRIANYTKESSIAGWAELGTNGGGKMELKKQLAHKTQQPLFLFYSST